MIANRHNSLGKSQHFSRSLHHHLVRKGIRSDLAAAVSAALSHPAKYAYDHTEVALDLVDEGHTLKEAPAAWKGLKQAEHLQSNSMITRGESITTLTQKVAARRAAIGAAGMLITEVALKRLGIPYNKCALSFGKLTIDAAEVASGGLAAETVVGGIFAAISAHAASQDSMELVTECFGVVKEKQEETRDEAISMRTVLYRP